MLASINHLEFCFFFLSKKVILAGDGMIERHLVASPSASIVYAEKTLFHLKGKT
jgi:hypothetical protein